MSMCLCSSPGPASNSSFLLMYTPGEAGAGSSTWQGPACERPRLCSELCLSLIVEGTEAVNYKMGNYCLSLCVSALEINKYMKIKNVLSLLII